MSVRSMVLVAATVLAGVFTDSNGQNSAPATTTAGARVGVVVLMPDLVTHFHESSLLQNSFMRTYRDKESIHAVASYGIARGLARRGLTPVVEETPEELQEHREDLVEIRPINSSTSPFARQRRLGDFMEERAPPREQDRDDGSTYRAKFAPGVQKALSRMAAEDNLSWIVVLAATYQNTTNREWNKRDWGLPDYVGGWGIHSYEESGAETTPTLFNFTQLLLLQPAATELIVVKYKWSGNDSMAWGDFALSPETKLMPPEDLQKLWKQYGVVTERQIEGLLGDFPAVESAH